MSVLGIAGSSLFNYLTQSVQNKKEQFQKEFQQLGQDLQSGNLTAIQSDYSDLQKDFQNLAAHGHSQHHHTNDNSSSSTISQLFSELGSALQSGNLTNAQQAYASLQQDLLQMTQGGSSIAPSISSTVSVSA